MLATMGRFTFTVSRKARRRLKFWQSYLQNKEGPLCEQAKASLQDKAFHAIGGSVYSLYGGRNNDELLTVIVDLQILVDYLDNLCDRLGVLEQRAFRTLHGAYLSALGVAGTTDYYRDFPFKEDWGYLDSLVYSCRNRILSWPNAANFKDLLSKYSRLYCDLQVYKHCRPVDRIPALLGWYENSVDARPFPYWWEFAAASGSTLLIFFLLVLAHSGHLDYRKKRLNRWDKALVGGDEYAKGRQKIVDYYFTTLAPLHILLDYLIDREEDKLLGDLNLVAFYPDEDIMVERLTNFYKGAVEQSDKLAGSRFHKFIARSLIALYLSDAKIYESTNQRAVQKILQQLDPPARLLQKVCLKGRKSIFNLSE